MSLIETNKDAHANEEDDKQHPLKSFGYGIDQWYQLLWELIKLFIPITAIGLVMIYINSTMGDLEGGSLPFVPHMSLGNFEGAFSACLSQPLGVGNANQTMTCPKGVISNLTHVGAIRGDEKEIKLKKAGPFADWSDSSRIYGNNYCGSPEYIEDEDDCQYIIPPSFRDNFNATCFN